MVIKNIKKLGSIAAISFGMISVAHAVAGGFYMGGQLGATQLENDTQSMQNDPSSPIEIISPSNNGLGARLFAGYGYNQYLALESGLTYYTPSRYSGVTVSGKIRESTLDLLGKATWPFYGFGIFGKAGPALIFASSSNKIISNSMSSSVYAAPVIAVGVSYDINQQWVVDLSYTNVLKAGSYTGAKFIALGISYHAVDVFCGQFLC